jgi:hypothetical protein
MMHIEWNELLQVFGATMLSTIVLVTLFSLGVRGLAKNPEHPENAENNENGKEGESVNISEAGPVLCFVLCLAIVAYGVYLIVAR